MSTGEVVQRALRNAVSIVPAVGEAVSAPRGALAFALSLLHHRLPPMYFFERLLGAPLILLGVLTLLGLIQLARNGDGLVPLYVAASVLMIIVTPWPGQFTRYLMPLTPFLLVAVTGLISRWSPPREPGAGERPRGRWRRLPLGVAAAALILVAGALTLWSVFRLFHRPALFVNPDGKAVAGRLFYYDRNWAAHDVALEWLRQTAGPEDVMATSTPHWAFLRTGRKAVLPPMEVDPERAQFLLDSVPVRSSWSTRSSSRTRAAATPHRSFTLIRSSGSASSRAAPRSIADDDLIPWAPGVRPRRGSSQPMTPGAEKDEPAGAVEVSVVMPCLNEADTLGLVHSQGQEAVRRYGLEARSWWPTTGAPMDPPPSRSASGLAWSGSKRGDTGTPSWAESRRHGGATSSWAMPTTATTSWRCRSSWRGCARASSSCRVAGCPPGAGASSLAPCPSFIVSSATPSFSALARRWFWSSIHDVYCGMRGFTRALYDRLELRCTGMEFATEMIIKASLHRARMVEIPITLHPDGRRVHAPHLRTFRDGWRTLRFFLLYSPSWLFLLPGLLLILLGLLGYAVALPGVTAGGVNFDAHTLLVASLAVICGYQAIQFGVFTKVYAAHEGLLPADRRTAWLVEKTRLEAGLLGGLAGMAAGLVLIALAVDQWRRVGFGHLDYAHTMRWVIPGVTLTVLGFQTCLSSFFLGVLGLKRR